MATETTMETRSSTDTESGIVSVGVVTGLVGGLLMLALLLPYAWASGMGVNLPAKAIASTFFGVDALIGGVGTIALGYAMHFVAAIFWGILFAWLVSPKLTMAGALAWAMAYGIGIWLFMTFAALPIVDPVLGARALTMPLVWFFGHFLFILPLAFAPRLRRRASRRRARSAAETGRQGPAYTPRPAAGPAW